VELVKGVAGVFEITIDGELKFSKKQLGRFPEDAEIDALIGSIVESRGGRPLTLSTAELP
jgi:predicted Rdx family selenoprotein